MTSWYCLEQHRDVMLEVQCRSDSPGQLGCMRGIYRSLLTDRCCWLSFDTFSLVRFNPPYSRIPQACFLIWMDVVCFVLPCYIRISQIRWQWQYDPLVLAHTPHTRLLSVKTCLAGVVARILERPVRFTRCEDPLDAATRSVSTQRFKPVG